MIILSAVCKYIFHYSSLLKWFSVSYKTKTKTIKYLQSFKYRVFTSKTHSCVWFNPAKMIQWGTLIPPQSQVFHVCLLTVGVSSWDPAMSTAASHPRSGCLVVGWWQSWSWQGWTQRPPVLPPLLSSPSTHTQSKAMSTPRALSRSASIHKSSTPIQYLNRGKLFSVSLSYFFLF